jgi:hypothetical protein
MHYTDGYSQCFLIWNIGMLAEFSSSFHSSQWFLLTQQTLATAVG